MPPRKTVLVTGSSGGIGLAIAKALTAEGYALILLTRTQKSIEKLACQPPVLNRWNRAMSCDMSEPNALHQFIADWQEPIWGIVHSAGICRTLELSEVGSDPWDMVVRVDLEAPYRLTKGLLPFVSRPGRIVNIASQLAEEGRAGYSAYCAAKFGLIGLTKCWAKELGTQGITVNAICPGWVDTEMTRCDIERLAAAHHLPVPQYRAAIESALELGRFNTSEEVANLVVFLLSERAAGVTGRDWLMQTIWNQE
jgi:NAD(P)-dependent dehydrogenase (short-subunit alcohol dehydrogenase family)